MTEEQQLIEMIAMIQKDYQKQIQPYVDRLVLLRSLQPPTPIFVSLEQAEKLGLNIEHLHSLISAQEKSMEWNYEGRPTEAGWYAVLICYDATEGIFPDARLWDGEKWNGKAVLAFGDKCESEDDAKRLADEYDIGG